MVFKIDDGGGADVGFMRLAVGALELAEGALELAEGALARLADGALVRLVVVLGCCFDLTTFGSEAALTVEDRPFFLGLGRGCL